MLDTTKRFLTPRCYYFRAVNTVPSFPSMNLLLAIRGQKFHKSLGILFLNLNPLATESSHGISVLVGNTQPLIHLLEKPNAVGLVPLNSINEVQDPTLKIVYIYTHPLYSHGYSLSIFYKHFHVQSSTFGIALKIRAAR